MAPATGLISMVGAKLKNPTNASAVASPVTCQAQMVRANLVIPVPRRETNCPTQTTMKPLIPDRNPPGAMAGSGICSSSIAGAGSSISILLSDVNPRYAVV